MEEQAEQRGDFDPGNAQDLIDETEEERHKREKHEAHVKEHAEREARHQQRMVEEAQRLAQEVEYVPEGRTDCQTAVFHWIEVPGEQSGHATISSDEVARVHGVPHKILVEYIQGEIDEAEACQTLPFTLLLVISYAMMSIAHDDAEKIRAVEDSVEFDIEENANFAFTGPMGHKAIFDANSHADFWSWMHSGFVPLLFQQGNGFHEGYPEDDPRFINASKSIGPRERGFVLFYNRLVAGVKMVQERSEEGECTLSVSKLNYLYNSSCVGGIDYQLMPEMGLPNEKAQTTEDPQRMEWLWAVDDIEVIQEKVKLLEAKRWLDRLTKKIEIGVAVYNAEFGVHTLVRVNFYFSRGGHIFKKVIPSSQYADWHDRWYYGFYDALWLVCILYIILAEAAEIYNIITTKGVVAIVTEYVNIWNFVDWSSVFFALAIVVIFVAMIDLRATMNDAMTSIGNMDPLEQRAAYEATTRVYYEALEANVNYVRYLKLALAFYPLVIIIRLFKSFAAQPRLAVVSKTIELAAPDLFHFMIVFGSVYLIFTIVGMTLFGREVGTFTTLPRAAISTFRLLMGDIDWEELSAIGRTEAGIWLWLFMIGIVLLMMNMILAIIMDNYSDVKNAAGNAETLLDEARQTWARWRGMRNGTFVPLGRVLKSLDEGGPKKHVHGNGWQPRCCRRSCSGS
eukprot:gnl/TRDRNA2_/TRDRNA2_176215_c0_seq2.p1 gnl/TRDRNA2_/TRDRNA2_176215_c0~~gnl/TRDRNA2_/TRDRNA2_176215_c0_seq2.p1  ORF type:complete len:680 (+),score=114.10 gnl/TRDRNA2_/TRDRNA2_176215_c0_seq2:141-2180(+)